MSQQLYAVTLGRSWSSGDAVRYNDLSSVEDADARRQLRTDFGVFLGRLSYLAGKHQLEQAVGAFLLHRHFSVRDDIIMLERSVLLRTGKKALVTQPSAISSGEGGVATRWAYDAMLGTFRPLEFSMDSGAARWLTRVDEAGMFAGEYADLLVEFGLSNLIGLTVVPRDHIPLVEKHYCLETTNDNSSVVTVELEDDGIGSSTVETAWLSVAVSGCSSRCYGRCRIDSSTDRHKFGHAVEHSYS